MTQTDAQIDPVRVAREAVAATRYGEQDKAAVLAGERDKYPAMELAPPSGPLPREGGSDDEASSPVPDL